MTPKECVRAVLNGKRPDRLPYVPCIDGYSQSGLPEKYRRMDVMAVEHHFGSDLIRGRDCFRMEYDETIKMTVDDKSSNGTRNLRTRFETPAGTLEQLKTWTPSSPFVAFPAEFIIKTPADLEPFRYLCDHTLIIPDYSRIQKAMDAYPDQLVAAGTGAEALRNLIQSNIGVENFTYFMFDYPDEMDETIRATHRMLLRMVDATAKGPAEVVVCYQNTNTANASPEWIEKYEFPHLDEYARICHEHGKKLLIHMCGHVDTLIDRIAGAEFDGIIDISPPPTGNCRIPEAVEKLSARGKVLAGGIDCNLYTSPDTEKLYQKTRALVDSIGNRDRFMLGSGDAVPQGVSPENLDRIKTLVGEYRN